jgi:glycosyltransferase involved in cell wall biosynthesis
MEALLSVQRQTFQDFELLVSDDGAQPEIASIVQALGDERIRYHPNARPLGMLGNKKEAFDRARGSFVANLDDDDVWEPTFLEELLGPLLAEDDVAVAFSDHWVIGADGKIVQDLTEANSSSWGRSSLRAGRHPSFARLGLVNQSLCTVQAAVMRADAADWRLIPPEVGPLYDQWLTYLLVESGRAAFYVPQRLASWRVHPGQYTLVATIDMHRRAAVCWDMLADRRALADIAGDLRRKSFNSRLLLVRDLFASGAILEAVWTGLGLLSFSNWPNILRTVQYRLRRLRRAELLG